MTHTCAMCDAVITEYSFHITLSSGKKVCEDCIAKVMISNAESEKEAA